MNHERNRHDVDLLFIKLERADNDFYESLIKALPAADIQLAVPFFVLKMCMAELYFFFGKM